MALISGKVRFSVLCILEDLVEPESNAHARQPQLSRTSIDYWNPMLSHPFVEKMVFYSDPASENFIVARFLPWEMGVWIYGHIRGEW